MLLYLRLLILTILLLTLADATAQCSLTVFAGDDATVCPGDLPYQLNGVVTGNDILGVQWEPAAAVDDARSRAPRFVGPATTTLTFTARSINEAENLLANPDFEAGDTGFTTEYVPGAGGSFGLLSSEGSYAISNNTFFTHSNFASCTDHTGGGGQMMVINGATTANENIYCQIVTVQAGRAYGLRAWVQSAVSENPAQLQFSVNGTLIGPILTAPSTTCSWRQFDDRWDSGAATSAEVCIVNQNTESSGNDFAIDDLFFGPICQETDEITITVPTADIVVEQIRTYTCNTPTTGLILDATGSSTGTGITYEWTTTTGNILSGANTLTPAVNRTGTYLFTLTRVTNGVSCDFTRSVTVLQDPNSVNANATAPDAVTCMRPQVIVRGMGSTTGNGVTYSWETTDGTIVSGSTGMNITVSTAGTYTLTVTGPTGCTATASATVNTTVSEPTINIEPFGEISCDEPTVTIDASGSQTGPGLAGFWTTSDGNIITTSNSGYVVEVNRAGTYQLRLVNNNTGLPGDPHGHGNRHVFGHHGAGRRCGGYYL